MRTGDSGTVHLRELTSSPAIELDIVAAVQSTAGSTGGVPIEQPVSSPHKSRGTSWLLVAGIVVLAVAAASGVAASRGLTARRAAQPNVAVLRPEPAPAPITPFQPNQEIAAPAIATGQPSPGQPAVAPRPEAPTNPGGPAAAVVAAAKRPVADTHAAVKAEEGAAPGPNAAEVEVPVVPARQTGAPADPLANAMEKAAGSNSSASDVLAQPARVATGPSDVPETPPQGAILGALGAKRQMARACVRGMDAPSRATLVFVSTGKVQSVAITGPAAGTPAEDCLSNALMKVSVEPFSRPTYTASTTITP
jgi:hypothetical protein